MKRLITALGLSALAFSASALEIGKPFEQLDLDRALPNIEFAPVEPYVAGSRAPFEQLSIDRALPDLPGRAGQYASAGGARVASLGAGAEADGDTPFGQPFAHDWSFIASSL
jgi:hypothetical protein